MSIITIIGAGMMGSAMSIPASDNGHEVRLVGTPLDRDSFHTQVRIWRFAAPAAYRPYTVSGEEINRGLPPETRVPAMANRGLPPETRVPAMTNRGLPPKTSVMT